METPYTQPVRQLLNYGDCSEMGDEWPDYCGELGFTAEHIPELIRMATDPQFELNEEQGLDIWAPAHAWRVLGQLRATEAVEPLLDMLYARGDEEWMSEEFPTVFKMIGPPAIAGLACALSDKPEKFFANLTIAESLQVIGNTYPEAKEDCITALTDRLERCTEQSPDLNAFFISQLIDLKAVDSLPAIRQAFEREYVDYSFEGDIENVEIEMGVRAQRSTPADYPTPRDRIPGFEGLLAEMSGRPGKRTKTKRNEPCPCGSGKKYKNCCLNHPDGPLQTDFLAMFSRKKISIRQKQREHVIQLMKHKQKDEAVRFMKELGIDDERLINGYLTRLV
jgi:hypothetical protein